MLIRFATLADKAACEPFNVRMAAPDNLDEKIARHDIIIAEEGSKIIGYLRLEKLWNNLPFISMVHVAQSRRRQGIGKQLLQFTAKNLPEANLIISSSKSNNRNAISWHEANGFQPCGNWNATHSDGCDELFFKKVVGGNE